MIGDCVIDASVGIKLFLVEEGSEMADQLFDQLVANPATTFYVPDLFYVECANVLWKYVRRFGYAAERAYQDVVDLQSLRLQTISTVDLLLPALELALAYDLTTYDACYVALARLLHCPFITADGILARKVLASEIDVRLLADL